MAKKDEDKLNHALAEYLAKGGAIKKVPAWKKVGSAPFKPSFGEYEKLQKQYKADPLWLDENLANDAIDFYF